MRSCWTRTTSPPAQQACVQAILRGARSAEDYVTHLQAITTGLPPAASAQTVSCADLAQACAALGRDLTAPKGDHVLLADRPPSPAGPGTLPGPDRLSAGSGKPAQQRRPLYPRRADLGLRPAPDRPAAVSLGSGQRARLLPRGTGQGRQALLHRGAQPPPRAGIWGWASIPPPRPPGPTAADYAWKTPPVGGRATLWISIS